jgi:Flp pilus assembly protein TadD
MLLPVAFEVKTIRPLAAVSLAAMLCAACAAGSDPSALALSDANAPAGPEAPATSSVTAQDLPPAAATPRSAEVADIKVAPATANAIRQARELRSSGKKREALDLLDKTGGADKDPALVGERGLLALELGQVDKAVDLLARSQNPGKPDWRMQSAYGAALSAAGRQKEAQAEFSKALAAAPGQPSILNNLALSYALEGRHEDAEKTLRQASAQSADPQARQNLALLLGLKGKTGEARTITQSVLPPDIAKDNLAYFDRVARTRVSAADPAATPEPVQSASASTGRPVMQLGVTE